MSYRNTSGLVPYQNRPDEAKRAARAEGKIKFIGSRCKHGHSGIRYTSTGQCVECKEMHRDNHKDKTQ